MATFTTLSKLFSTMHRAWRNFYPAKIFTYTVLKKAIKARELVHTVYTYHILSSAHTGKTRKLGDNATTTSVTLFLSLSCSTLMLASSSCCCSSLSLICTTLKTSLKPSTSAPSPLDTAGAALANCLIFSNFSWILSLDPNWSVLATPTKCHVHSEYSE